MSNPVTNSGIRDNYRRGKAGDFLRAKIRDGSRLSFVSAYFLDDAGITYDSKDDLPKLYRKAAETLNLAPSQHTKQLFKQILGGCHAVVEGLGALRNQLSDAHGKGKAGVRPASRHAELAVNLAGTVATFLIQTQEARQGK